MEIEKNKGRMIFQSFKLGNLVSLCMKIINSVVVVGLYYGFLTTFSIGSSYLFLLHRALLSLPSPSSRSGRRRRRNQEESINNNKFYYETAHDVHIDLLCASASSIGHFILPSSMLVRLVNIYMFRCNNKMLFVTSSFVGWLIGHILFMKWVGLVLVLIQHNNSIRSNVLITSNKYLVAELRNFMARIFSILLFITCIYYLGRIPSPIVTKKLNAKSSTEDLVK
ncbi:hypothetical protein F8388_016247 [Cannabis sativa]|uniref:Translocon at the inner envelope membrane of chloroplasts 214 n=1 Tax=Cannabis sativa TaxID=3483 RepID=A0A7J6GEA3_CANSA|nr:hypothetical protein F8388_016247 [Cannabis sativa]KAF4381910.1 hypothetical protein G4B88_024312 [Cannabis sativa]